MEVAEGEMVTRMILSVRRLVQLGCMDGHVPQIDIETERRRDTLNIRLRQETQKRTHSILDGSHQLHVIAAIRDLLLSDMHLTRRCRFGRATVIADGLRIMKQTHKLRSGIQHE